MSEENENKIPVNYIQFVAGNKYMNYKRNFNNIGAREIGNFLIMIEQIKQELLEEFEEIPKSFEASGDFEEENKSQGD